MAIQVTFETDKSAQRLGWGLLAVALASPIAISPVGSTDFAKAGKSS